MAVVPEVPADLIGAEALRDLLQGRMKGACPKRSVGIRACGLGFGVQDLVFGGSTGSRGGRGGILLNAQSSYNKEIRVQSHACSFLNPKPSAIFSQVRADQSTGRVWASLEFRCSSAVSCSSLGGGGGLETIFGVVEPPKP